MTVLRCADHEWKAVGPGARSSHAGGTLRPTEWSQPSAYGFLCGAYVENYEDDRCSSRGGGGPRRSWATSRPTVEAPLVRDTGAAPHEGSIGCLRHQPPEASSRGFVPRWGWDWPPSVCWSAPSGPASWWPVRHRRHVPPTHGKPISGHPGRKLTQRTAHTGATPTRNTDREASGPAGTAHGRGLRRTAAYRPATPRRTFSPSRPVIVGHGHAIGAVFTCFRGHGLFVCPGRLGYGHDGGHLPPGLRGGRKKVDGNRG